MTRWKRKDLLGIAELDADEIRMVLDTAESFREVAERPVKKVPTLRGKTVINLFFEASTRTRASFEIAEKRLSADNINLTGSGMSIEKGESLVDTARNLQAMAPDLIVIRHGSCGVPHLLADRIAAGVINAGDGAHEHPTQALLDAYTIRRAKGAVAGLRVAIVGDIAHSRVVRSNLHLLTKLGASVVVAGPRTMMPIGMGDWSRELGFDIAYDLDEALEGADVVMMLRVQLERQGGALFPSVREYFRLFALTEKRLARAKSDVVVLHPGPINRGTEIASDVADGRCSLILDQVANGVAVRMAVLYLLAGPQTEAMR